MRTLDAESVQCVVTSPPYWKLRDYGVDGALGNENTIEEYVANLVDVFREVKRVLRKDGTLWLNLGDCYVKKNLCGIPWRVAFAIQADGWSMRRDIIWSKPNCMPESCKDRPTSSHEYLFLLTKSPRYYYDWAAIAEPVSAAMLQQIREGYNGSATKDFDANGVQNASDVKKRVIAGKKIPSGWDTGKGNHDQKVGRYDHKNLQREKPHSFHVARTNGKHSGEPEQSSGHRIVENVARAREENPRGQEFRLYRNKRSVWTISPQPYSEAHFATFPEALVRPCILAGTKPGDVVLDPFGGSGTTGKVAKELGRQSILIELNPDYIELAQDRTNVQGGLL